MPPPSASSALHLLVLPKPFRVFKLSPSTSFPLALISILQKPPIGDEFVSITRNTDEVSVVTDHVFDQKDELGISEEGDLWRCIKVRGPMEHGLTGIMAALTAPLRDVEVPIFAISTWDTDWLLVGLNKLEKAIEALRADGPYSDDLLFYHDTGLAGGFAPLQKHEACYAKWRPHFSTLNLARSSDSSTPSTPKSSYIANLPPESPTSPLAPRSPSPAGRNSQTPSTSRPPSQLRIRDSRPPYLPFRRISLPSAPAQKRDSVASIFSVDSVKEHDENESPSQPNGQASASLPTDSSLPDLGLPLPPPIPASRTPLSSSPSRRVVIIAPPAASNVPSTPSRVRPRPISAQSLAKGSNHSPGRLIHPGSKSRRTLLSKPLAEEKVREREEKRRRIAKELLDTEQSYVDGLDLVYNHFLAPLIESLATAPHPLVTPADLGVIFPGFIDILNFNRSFLSELRSILTPHLVTRSVPIPIPGSNPSSTSLISQQQPIPISSASSRPSLPNEAGSFIPHEPSTSWNSRLHLTSESQASLQLVASAIGFPLDDSSSIHARGASTASENMEPTLLPSLVTVLAQHVPYLRLYKPFVTGFPASMERLAKLSANESFRIWLKEREKDPACGMLGLRSWLLSIVQRCPRYLLLVKDLEKSSDEADEGYKELSSVLALLTKITNALNTSLADHTAVLALLDLQRSTSSLPPGFSFVAPGRSLIRRGRLRMSGQEVSQGGVMRRVAGTESERELLLFSDCVVWLERELEWGLVSASSAAGWASAASGNKSGDSAGSGKPGGAVRHSAVGPIGLGKPSQALKRPSMGRTRSKSEAELPTLKSQNMGLGMTPETMRSTSGSSSAFVTRETPAKRESPPKRPPPKPLTTMEGSISSEERWRFRGVANLMDVEVVVSPRNAMQIDFLSPEGSFALYASTYDEREEWINAIRSSKATLLATFNITHPDSTLTSSSSTTHLRRVLQALPYPPGEATIRGAREPGPPRRSILGGRSRHRQREPVVVEDNEDADTENSQPGRTAFAKQSRSEKQKERRGRVEHYVPPIWVPDREADACMRCQAAFGWRRRRHHCRICGRVVCASCSSKNFFVMDPSKPDASKSRKPERACTLCYEAVFPVIHSSTDSINNSAERGGTIMALRQSPARPRILEHLVSTSPITTPAIERPMNGALEASPSSPTMLTPSSVTPSGATELSSASSKSGARSGAKPAQITSSTTERTIRSLDSQRTVQPHVSMASDLSSMTSASQSPSRPRSLDVGRRFAAASAFVHTAGVTARSKVIGKGKGRRVSLRAGARERENTVPSIPSPNRQDSIATLGRGAAAQQLNELLGRSPH
ncbi:Protein present in Fab1, YOTB, Vac1, and EEA1 [Rhizoctonia solani]|uniref:Protein present in Fab1, YOTB, Vac1, and EEA1 n=1 Tax=Rhizoctonia solani TaxID=456999 RepID=A0A8H7H3X2_9AGAM|nr:Protein present in Fab1, YOTB, Vac1, and EEA1 [Rhizoctonia solani]